MFFSRAVTLIAQVCVFSYSLTKLAGLSVCAHEVSVNLCTTWGYMGSYPWVGEVC